MNQIRHFTFQNFSPFFKSGQSRFVIFTKISGCSLVQIKCRFPKDEILTTDVKTIIPYSAAQEKAKRHTFCCIRDDQFVNRLHFGANPFDTCNYVKFDIK